ncbi:LacI family DNA-binding transcriptional regulator [Proteiniclasticum ruminis]|uniref:LacI family transcriptional regulator n=1 Tax=Proteiniclasticum ruminis TaxID=398199 RepID=A0A1G8JUH2_9CLOT|nr:LacI family DNA-binding transcriptional regulator [Proteiniclasticum ruminis]SDI34869.1 LacI family transcriptional regulator [Proteiniclasticum ruminis]
MKKTIKDIAKEAGVSIATVSFIVNGKDQHISEATRQRVKDVMKKYNYIPNAMAGSLVTRRTGIIGLVLPDITNPFFPGIARGAEDRANEEGYSIIFCNTDDKIEVEEKYIESLSSKMVDGIIIAHSSNSEEMGEILERTQIPIILIDRDFDSKNILGKVLVNNKDGAYQAVCHMVERGYKKIAYLSGSLKTQTAMDRLEGYKEALKEKNLPVEEHLIKYGEYRAEWGRKGVKELLTEKRDFDAVFCGNDLIAIGAMKELLKNGYKVPEDKGVMGFDDIYMAQMVEPELTTVKQPNYEMGYQAVDLLIKHLKEKKSTKSHTVEKKTSMVMLNTEITERKSI